MMKLMFLTLITFLTSFFGSNQAVSVDNLRCEYLQEPLGVDMAKPRFSWELVTTATGRTQQAYQLQVSAATANFEDAAILVWDSGKVVSSATNQVY